MNIEIGDIVYYNSPTRLETYGIVVRKAKWIDTFEDGEVFYYVRSLCDKTVQDELVYEDYIISLYKKEN
jgi:hypothetical protein